MYYFDQIIEAGAEMTFGTDWSVSDSPNLFPALRGAVEHGEHSIDLRTGLAALTVNGAHAVGEGHRRGSPEPGRSADFIVLDRNLFDIPPPRSAAPWYCGRSSRGAPSSSTPARDSGAGTVVA